MEKSRLTNQEKKHVGVRSVQTRRLPGSVTAEKPIEGKGTQGQRKRSALNSGRQKAGSSGSKTAPSFDEKGSEQKSPKQELDNRTIEGEKKSRGRPGNVENRMGGAPSSRGIGRGNRNRAKKVKKNGN